MAQGQKYGYWQGNAGPVGPPPGFMEMATSGTRALARGIESASKSITDALKEKDEEEKTINKLAKASDTAMKAVDSYAKATGQPHSVYGEKGEAGYLSMSAEERISHYEGASKAQDMIGKLMSNRASKLQGDVYEDQMEEGDATNRGVRQTLEEFAKPPVPMPPLPQGFGDEATPAQQQGSVAPTQKPFMQRRADAIARALMLNPDADVTGMTTAVDRLLPEPDEKGTAIPGSLNETGHPDYYFGIQSDSGAGTFIRKPGADGDGKIEVKEVDVPGADEKFKVVVQDGKVVPSATTALHRGSAEKNPFDELNSQGQQLVSQWVRSYWSALKEKSDLEADMATNNLKQGDDVPATEGWFGAGGDSYEELHEKLDDKIADMMQKMNSFNIHPNDFNRTTGQPNRNLGTDMSFDAFQRENQ